MPSITGHFVVGASLALPCTASPSVTRVVRPFGVVLLAGLLATAPDLDTIFFDVVPYGHFFGHRGFFHSPLFAVLLSLVVSTIVFAIARQFTGLAWLTVSLALSVSAASHGFLDSMSDAGLGVMLLYPWSEQRVFLSWRPFYTPPIGPTGFTWPVLVRTLRSEWWLMMGCATIGVLSRLALVHLHSTRRSPGSLGAPNSIASPVSPEEDRRDS